MPHYNAYIWSALCKFIFLHIKRLKHFIRISFFFDFTSKFSKILFKLFSLFVYFLLLNARACPGKTRRLCIHLEKRILGYISIFLAKQEAKFKELERRLKFQPQLKYGWFGSTLNCINFSRFKPALNWNRFLGILDSA